MTATAAPRPRAALGPGQAAPAHAVPGPSAGARRPALATPTALRFLLAALVLLSLAWGAFGGWVAADHSSAAGALVAVDEPLSLDAQQMYQSIADADATVTAALLASSQPSLSSVQRYQGDIAMAAADLSRLRAGDAGTAADTSLAALSTGLAVYAQDVAEARTAYALGYALTGTSFVQVASEQAHVTLLPAANAVFARENAVRDAASSRATGLPLVLAAIVLAVITGYVLYRAQRWLIRRTNRMFSPGLVLASVLLVVSVIWLAAGLLAARTDLDSGIGHGAAPGQNLALASIGVQRIRGDAVLNVISRSGNASFSEDSAATSKQVGPGDGSWLSAAAAAEPADGRAAPLVTDAERDATAWYSANQGVYEAGTKADYAGEQKLVVGTGAGSTAPGYGALETELSRAISADDAVFATGATAGQHVLQPLAWVVIVASVLMAAASGWAISRRLTEYR